MAKEDKEDKEAQEAADQFARACNVHMSSASNVQKIRLLNALAEHPPEIKDVTVLAQKFCNGMTESETIKFLVILQQQFDKDTWEFVARWRK